MYIFPKLHLKCQIFVARQTNPTDETNQQVAKTKIDNKLEPIYIFIETYATSVNGAL